MSDEPTRQPRSEGDYAAMIMQLVKANTLAEAYDHISQLTAIRPLVWVRTDNGQIEASGDLTVGVTFQLIRFLEGRGIR